MARKIQAIVIDDDGLMRRLVASILTELDCGVVGIGKDGAAAVELYRENKPDLVFLDINMPDVDGLVALRRIFKFDPDAHVVMLTGNADTAVAESCISAGAKDYLHKDAGPEVLRQGLERAVRQRR